MAASQDPPPAYTPAPNSFNNPTQEEEIACRESALNEGERNLERIGRGDRPNNFPPFLKFCPAPCKPCCYFSIKTEVPRSEQWKMYGLFALLIYIWVVYLVNVGVAILGATVDISVSKRPEYLSTLAASTIYLALFVPGSLFCWFLPAYCAYRSGRTLFIAWFIIVMIIQILEFPVNASGIPNLGACGFLNGATFFNSHLDGNPTSPASIATGAMFLIVAILWILGLPVAIVLLIMICIYFLCGAGRRRSLSVRSRLNDEMDPEERVIIVASNQ